MMSFSQLLGVKKTLHIFGGLSQTNLGPSYFVRTLTFFVSYVSKIGNNLWERTKKVFVEKIAKLNYLLYQKIDQHA